LKLTIIAVGKIKEKFYREAVQEYVKRLGRYCKVQILEMTDEKTPDRASEREEQLIKETEGERILAALPKDAYVIALAIEGKMYDSVELSRHIDQLQVAGKGHLVLIIGGSLGLSRQVLGRADETLSFSRMTFPHQLMRVILLEQLYRSFRIVRGEPYHK